MEILFSRSSMFNVYDGKQCYVLLTCIYHMHVILRKSCVIVHGSGDRAYLSLTSLCLTHKLI